MLYLVPLNATDVQPDEQQVKHRQQQPHALGRDRLHSSNLTTEVGSVVLAIATAPLIGFANGVVSNVTVSNLVLEDTRGSAVAAMSCVDCTFLRLEARRIGLEGITLDPHSTGSRVVQSHLYDLGVSGVSLAGGKMGNLTAGNQRASNCHVHDWGWWSKVYTAGVSLRGVANTIENCELHDGPHLAIVVGGNNHLITRTDIHNVVLTFADMGAVYMNLGLSPFERGSAVVENYFHDFGQQHDLTVAVYPDNASMNVTIAKNVFFNLGKLNHSSSVRAIMGNGYSYVNVTNNFFFDCRGVMVQSMFFNSWAAPKFPEYMQTWRDQFDAVNKSGRLPLFYDAYPELEAFWTEDRKEPRSSSFTKNMVWNPTLPRMTSQPLGYEVESGNMSDVHAADQWLPDQLPSWQWRLKDKNFSVPANEVKIPGWQPIAFDKIGLNTSVGPSL
eukprot:m.68542 g.68542  ORF g.68542 m.68542 type:complete len:443 (-) comp13913_c0_seq1:146-1474(-)